jgi:hypothetical protein
MSQVVILLVGAMWAAVLLPPLFRAKIDRPQSSVDVFRRQLHTLQTGMAPQQMSPYGPRPYGAPQRPMVPRQMNPYAGRPMSPAPMRAMARPFAPAQPAPRRMPAAPPAGVRLHHNTPAYGMPRVSSKQMVRRRRQNIFNAILGINIASLFLAFTTGSTLMIWVFAIAFLSFIGYCYMLAQIRAQQASRRYARPYYRAA